MTVVVITDTAFVLRHHPVAHQRLNPGDTVDDTILDDHDTTTASTTAAPAPAHTAVFLPGRGHVLTKSFVWAHYPPLEDIL
jgi:hypothetical protein